jgi:hypothetical protein
LLNLADCRERNHQLASAWALFGEAERRARAASDDKLARVGANHAHKLEPRLSRLTLAVAADRQVAGLELVRNGERVDAASWNRPLPVDGGTLMITARAPGFAPWSTTKLVKPEADAQTIAIPRLVASPPAVVATRPVPASESPSPTSTAAPEPVASSPPAVASVELAARVEHDATPVADVPERASYTVPIVVGAGAVALGVGALGFELAGSKRYDDAKRATDQHAQDTLESGANNRHYVAQGLGVAAVAAAGVSVYLFVRSHNQRRETVAVAPVASPQLTGLAVGRW